MYGHLPRCVFDDPRNRTLDELHLLALERVQLGDDVKLSVGAGLHLTPTARALAYLVYNKTI